MNRCTDYRCLTITNHAAYRWLVIFLALAFLFSPLAAPAQAAAPEGAIRCASLHEVQPGETLAKIAARYYLTADELKAANPWLSHQPLQAGSQLCIPSARVIIDHSRAKFEAYLIFGHLTVYGWGFPKNYRYNVRVMADRTDIWYKVGHLFSAKDGTILGNYKLPKDIRYPHRLKVCLKEVKTGWTICKNADVYLIYP